MQSQGELRKNNISNNILSGDLLGPRNKCFPVNYKHCGVDVLSISSLVSSSPVCWYRQQIIAPAKTHFSTKKYQYLSYFSMETYVVVLIRSASPRRF